MIDSTNGNTPDSFGDPVTDNGDVAFKATSNPDDQGIYIVDAAGTLTEVVDTDTNVPGSSTVTFDSLSDPSLDNGEVAFKATSNADDQGIYIVDADGTLTEVVDTDTEVPDTTTTSSTVVFDSLSDPSLDDGLVAFTATTSDGSSGLYIADTSTAGTVNIETVIEIDDKLDGKTLSSLVLSQDAVDNGSLVFLADFDDGSQGIYLAGQLGQILLPQGAPTPATAALLLTGLGLIGFKRRRSQAIRA